MSLIFSSEEHRPIFHHELSNNSVDGVRKLTGAESHRISLSGTRFDPKEVSLAPGNYRVLASRGPEYDVTQTQIKIVAGKLTTLNIQPPKRVVPTPGLISADFHVHSGVSFDSSLTPRQRVIDFAAQGCEVLVATEHNVTYDIAPTITQLGLEHSIKSLSGVELTGMARGGTTPTTIGHSNVFPVAPQALEFMGGTLAFEGKRLGVVIGEYKSAYPDSLVQLNHPRTVAFDDDITYFNHLSQGVAYNPSLSLEEAPNNLLLEEHPSSQYRDIDFDAIELLNGESMELYAPVRDDWFSLIKQNHFKVAMANSDSHRGSQLVSYPRSMVELDNDDPSTVSDQEIVAAVAAGKVYGTTGPILHVEFEGAGPGATVHSSKGTLTVGLSAAPWVTLDKVQIWLNDTVWKTIPANVGDTLKIEIEVQSDSFVFVEAYGEPSEIYRAVAPAFTPFAFANPVFLDVGGDGWRYGTR